MRSAAAVTSVLIVFLGSGQQSPTLFVGAQVPEKCSVCKTCIECTKCQSPCEFLCDSPLCQPCLEPQADGLDCYTTKDENTTKWNGYCANYCSPACQFCTDCDRCEEFCEPCNQDPCNTDDCSLKSITHDQCDNGDQCSAGCLSACAPCLNCAQCAGCRQECGHCDDCYNYPDSGACATNSCNACKSCEPCMTCTFTDDSACDICNICVITHNDEKAWDRNNGSVYVQPSETAFDPNAELSTGVSTSQKTSSDDVKTQSFNAFTASYLHAQSVSTQQVPTRPLTVHELALRQSGSQVASSDVHGGGSSRSGAEFVVMLAGAYVALMTAQAVRYYVLRRTESTTLISRSDMPEHTTLISKSMQYGTTECAGDDVRVTKKPLLGASDQL